MQNEVLVYVGTYTDFSGDMSGREKSKGIYILKLNMESGQLSPYRIEEGVKNPSFLTMDSDKKFLYAVNELQDFAGEATGAVSSFEIIKNTGELKFLNQRPSMGKDPCHIIAVNGTILTANYTSGTVSVYGTDAEGFGSLIQTIRHSGKSVHIERQESAHAHSCILSPDRTKVFVCDLGMDRIMSYKLMETGELEPNEIPYYECEQGSGPRFGEFHPTLNYFYVINELSSTVTVLKYDNSLGKFMHIQTIPTVSSEYKSNNTGADLHISRDGKFLYASNRGHDSLAIFRINAEDGTLISCGQISTGGETPRNFSIDPTDTYILAGNQNSDTIVVFARDKESGLFSHVSKVHVPAPVCIYISE